MPKTSATSENEKIRRVLILENPKNPSALSSNFDFNEANQFVTQKTEPNKPVVVRQIDQNSKTSLRKRRRKNSRKEVFENDQNEPCVDCCENNRTGIIIVCVILIVIGLVGLAFSAYFLAINRSSNLVPAVVGLVVGIVLVLSASTFLLVALLCLYRRQKREEQIEEEIRQQQKQAELAEQVVIEMPERFISGKKIPETERDEKLKKVVKNLNQIVEDARRRTGGEKPNKIIVQIEDNK